MRPIGLSVSLDRPATAAQDAARFPTFVDPDQLDELVAARLIRRHDPFGPQVLQHPVVRIVGRADVGDRGQRCSSPATVIASP